MEGGHRYYVSDLPTECFEPYYDVIDGRDDSRSMVGTITTVGKIYGKSKKKQKKTKGRIIKIIINTLIGIKSGIYYPKEIEGTCDYEAPVQSILPTEIKGQGLTQMSYIAQRAGIAIIVHWRQLRTEPLPSGSSYASSLGRG